MKKTIVAMTLILCMVVNFLPVFASSENADVVLDGTVGITDMGEYYADVTIENPVHNAVLMVALYQDNVLSGHEEILLTATSERDQLFVEAPKADSAKFFAFESLETMKPLGKMKEVLIPENPDYIVTVDGSDLTGTYHNLVIAPQIADGEVTLTGATVNGDLVVKGGGSNSIHLNNCIVEGKVMVEKEGGQPPRLNLVGTNLELVEAKTATLIEGEGEASSVRRVVATADVVADSSVAQKIEIPQYAEERVNITIEGTDTVDVEVNTSVGVEVIGGDVTVSTTLEEMPTGIVQDGETLTHIHKWDEPKITDPTCETSGEALYTCADGDCSVSKTEVLPALGHKYGDWKEFDATHHAHVCERDSSHLEKQEHKWDNGVTVKESTKEEEGLKKFTCTVCKETKEETIPVLSDVEFSFSRDQYGNVIVTWTNNDYPNYYYEFEDSKGNSAGNGWSEPGKNYATLLSLPTPDSGTETYSLVLYAADENYNADWDHAFARLDDCVEVTISGDAYSYSMSFHHPEAGKHILTLGADIPANTIQMGIWYINGRRAGVSSGRSSSVKKAGVQETYSNDRVKDGDSFDFRLADVEILNLKKITATMTPPSKKTYLENDTTIFTFMEGDGLRLAWKDAGIEESEKYLVTLRSPEVTLGTSLTTVPLGAYLARENVPEGIVTAQVQKATAWTPTGDIYPETEIANITLSGTNPAYTIARHEDGSYHFVSDMTGGAWVYMVYNENGTMTHCGNTVGGAIDTYANFKDGSRIAARYVTWELNDTKTFAEISISNVVELQYKQDGLMVIQDGAFLRLTWPNYACSRYYVAVLDKNGNQVENESVSGDVFEISSFGGLLPMPESGENTYDIVLYEQDSAHQIVKELDRMEDVIKVLVTGTPLPYEIAYDTPEGGQHTLTFDITGYAENSGMRYSWRNGDTAGGGYSMHAKETDTMYQTLVDGMTCDYRIISPMVLKDQLITMTMTPPSVKTYTAK